MEKNTLIITNKSRGKKKVIKKGIKSFRNPGIDLMRLIGMLDIVIFHILIDSNIFNRYSKYRRQLDNMAIFGNWHISNFGIISGIVGYKNSNHLKYSNLFYLWLTVFFYSLTIHYAYKKYNRNFFSTNRKIQYYFPVIFNNHWYFTSYFGMYFFLPLINRGISYLQKGEFTIVVLGIIGIFIIWNDYFLLGNKDQTDPFSVHGGRSMIGLILFYIIGAYIGKHIIVENKNRRIYYYIICLLIFFASGQSIIYFLTYYGHNKYKLFLQKFCRNRLNSLATMAQTISLNLLFSQIKYNKYISKIISFFGQLAFGVYIIHDHIDIRYVIFANLFQNYPDNLTLNQIKLLVILKGLKYFSICILIDLIRFFIFKLLMIRLLLNFIEKKIYSIIGIYKNNK